MKKTFFKFFSALSICCILGATLMLSERGNTQDKLISDRVTNLEIQVLDLQSRVMSLEKQISNQATSSIQSNKNVPAGITSWRSLQKGMSKDQVRRILGEPESINVLTYSETWWFAGYGNVSFDNSGRVTGWSEP